MKKIAILGANGFLGLPIAEAFRLSGWEVVAFSKRQHNNSMVQEFKVDLFDLESLNRALLKSKPDVVISTAWVTEHWKLWTSELNVNYRDATLKFAEACFQAGVESFAGIGTGGEYGIKAGICNTESSPLIPNDVYAASKIETGLKLKEIGETFGAKSHWFRIFQAFGPNEKPERFIPGLISSLKQRERFSISTPENNLDWIHTADIASAVVYCLENELRHFVDVGTGVATSVREVSELICAELDLDANLLDYSVPLPGSEKTAVVDSASLLFTAGWKPAETLERRIRSLG